MNANDKKMLNECRELLAELIDFNPNLVNQVVNKNIFTQKMMDDIQKVEEPMNRKRRFLHDLTRRGPDAVDQFVEVLYGINQLSAAKLLRPESFKGMNPEQVIQNITSPMSPPVDSAAITVSPIAALVNKEPNGVGHTISEVTGENFMNTVQVTKTPFVGDNIYPMVGSPRGFCLVFNIYEFKDGSYETRKGSIVDANRLRDVFTELHYDVKLFENSNLDDLKKAIDLYSKHKDLRSHESIVVIVLSHGMSQHVITSEGRAIAFEEIVRHFNNENCPQLIEKPKLFFFNCCRGEDRDAGPKKLIEEGEYAVSDAKAIEGMINKVPTADDIMICYSTVDGFVSWRNEESGSWFCTALSQALMKHSHDKELHHILTLASSTITNKITNNGFKQVMEHVYRGFKKLFYFNPGIVPETLLHSDNDSTANPNHSNGSAQ